MIERPSIIITSLGRTGTTFFANLFGEIIPNSSSFHEPDIYQYYTNDRYGAFIKRVKDAGLYNMVFLKLLGKWSLMKVSDERFTGKLRYENAVKMVIRQRDRFVNTKPGSVYIESNAGYYGLIDVLRGVYRSHNVIFIIRNGRDWVSSALNVGELYANRGLRDLFAHKMPIASQFPDDPLGSDWESASRFVKLCWAWSKLNAYALETVENNPNARMFQFEHIFVDAGKYQNLNELVSFATTFPGISPLQLGSTKGWLEKKINKSENNPNEWEKWTREEKHQFEDICGPIMQKLGYDK